MAFSGSMRAKLRVFVSKHFFSYRYDYRDEWLRFTQALSARGGQPELGQDVVKGLADLLESPAGACGCATPPGRHVRAGRALEHAGRRRRRSRSTARSSGSCATAAGW